MGNVLKKKNERTKIVDLPVETISEITKYLSPKENINLGLVNKNLMEKYRNEYCLFKKIAFEISKQEDFDNFAKCKLNYGILIVHTMDDKNKTTNCKEKLKQIRTLQILYNGWSALELILLLERCTNLKTLHVNLDRIIFDKHSFSAFKLITNVLTLNELQIDYAVFIRLDNLISQIDDNKTIKTLSFYGFLSDLSYVTKIAEKFKALRTITFNFRHLLTENEIETLERNISLVNNKIKLIFPSLISRNFLK